MTLMSKGLPAPFDNLDLQSMKLPKTTLQAKHQHDQHDQHDQHPFGIKEIKMKKNQGVLNRFSFHYAVCNVKS